MAIDFNLLETSTTQIAEKAGQLRNLIHKVVEGKTYIEGEQLTYPSALMDALKTKYTTLKQELITLVNSLP